MCFVVLLNQNLAIKGFRATTVEKIIQVILFEKMNSKVKIDEMIFQLICWTLKSFISLWFVLRYKYFDFILFYVSILQIKKFSNFIIWFFFGFKRRFIMISFNKKKKIIYINCSGICVFIMWYLCYINYFRNLNYYSHIINR